MTALAFSLFSKGLIWLGVVVCALGVFIWISVAARSVARTISIGLVGVPLIGAVLLAKLPGDLIAKRRARA